MADSGLANNPIYQRLTRSPRLPSPRVALWAAFGAGLTLTAYLVIETLNLASLSPTVGSTLIAPGIILTLLMPFVTTLVAATLTTHDFRAEVNQLIRLTNLTSQSMVLGYVGAALHRVRWLLAVMIALWPAIVIGTFQSTILAHAQYGGIDPGATPWFNEGYVVSSALTAGALVLVLWADTVLAAVVGVWSGLARREAVHAWLVAIAIMFANYIFPIIGLTLLGPNIGQTAFGPPGPTPLLIAVAITAGVFALSVLLPGGIIFSMCMIDARRLLETARRE